LAVTCLRPSGLYYTFLCSHKFPKIENYFSFQLQKKKFLANFLRILELFTQKIVTMLSKIWVWDPGSEIRDPEKTFSGSRIQGSKRHRIPDPQHWQMALGFVLKTKIPVCGLSTRISGIILDQGRECYPPPLPVSLSQVL
jgi:hypothetical protein